MKVLYVYGRHPCVYLFAVPSRAELLLEHKAQKERLEALEKKVRHLKRELAEERSLCRDVQRSFVQKMSRWNFSTVFLCAVYLFALATFLFLALD